MLLFPAGSFTEHSVQHRALNYQFSAGLIQDGWNSIVIMNCDGSHSVEVIGVELGVYLV